MTSERVILSIENLKGAYKGVFGIVIGTDDVTLEVKSGEIVAIAGESGCGKSTLAELLTGTPMPLLHYESGKVIVDGFNIYEISKKELRTEIKSTRMSYVPQASMESLNPVKKLINFIFDVVSERTLEKNIDKVKIREFAESHFLRVGLDKSVLDRFPHELSGGMKQRAVIAISTMWNPKVLIVDEPTSALDVTSQRQVVQMLYELKQKKIIETILFISHDIPTLRQICERCVIMYAGWIVEDGTMNEIIDNPQHPYTKGLVNAIVSFHPDGSIEGELVSIPGSPPNLKDPPLGCRFHPRCPKAMPICKSKKPPLFFDNSGTRPVRCWLFKGDT